MEINKTKTQIIQIQRDRQLIKPNNDSNDDLHALENQIFLELISQITIQNGWIRITISLENDFRLDTITIINSGADLNYIQEDLIHIKYFKKMKRN